MILPKRGFRFVQSNNAAFILCWSENFITCVEFHDINEEYNGHRHCVKFVIVGNQIPTRMISKTTVTVIFRYMYSN